MKYIAFFDLNSFAHEKRSIDLAGCNVVDFNAQIFSQIETVEIISPVRTLHKKGYYKGRNIKINDRISLIIPPSFGSNSKISRLISILWIQIWFFFTLLFKIKKNERVIAYHSLSTMIVLRILKRIKNFKLTLEIREIYADVLHLSEKDREKELKYFEIADNYIFPTVILNNHVNKEHKPFVIASGIYKDEKLLTEKYNDNKIHLVYAGTLDRLKSGALRSVRIAEYLDDKYVIHILGKGAPETLNELLKEIERLSASSKCLIQYDGELRGEEFKRYIQKCHIGLALQDLSGLYNMTSFPSKILTYLANGLQVVCPRIPAIVDSPVGKMLNYYENDSSVDISNIIKKIKIKDKEEKYNNLSTLADKLQQDLMNLIYGKE